MVVVRASMSSRVDGSHEHGIGILNERDNAIDLLQATGSCAAEATCQSGQTAKHDRKSARLGY